MRHLFILISTLVLLSGCAQNNEDTTTAGISDSYYQTNLLSAVNYDVYQGKNDADREILESAHAVTASLEKLAHIEQAIHPKARLPKPKNPMRTGLADLASVDWSGPIEPLLKQLARSNHYKLHVLGRRPAIPVLIAINKDNISMATLLRDIEYQSQRKATIQLYPSKKIIELRYKKV